MRDWIKRILQNFGFGPEKKDESYWAYRDGYQIRDKE